MLLSKRGLVVRCVCRDNVCHRKLVATLFRSAPDSITQMNRNEQYMKLKICEIFKSIQGESSYAGLPCVFIRLSGCNLRCRYCDTTYAWSENHEMQMNEIIDTVLKLECDLALVTGGEPLIQSESQHLIEALLDNQLKTLVETNGTCDISNLPADAIRIVDVKCPGSGESGKFFSRNLKALRPHDEVKFVITDRYDYDWSKDFMNSHLRDFPGQVLLSPAFGLQQPADLVSWILEDNLRVRFQIQLHKVIWDPNMRGV